MHDSRPKGAFTTVGLFDERIPGGSAEDYDWFLRATCEGPIGASESHWFAFIGTGHPGSPSAGRSSPVTEYLLAKHPSFTNDNVGYARIASQIALAHAGRGEPVDARRWARRALVASPRQVRAWVALLSSFGLLSVNWVVRVLARFGRGLI